LKVGSIPERHLLEFFPCPLQNRIPTALSAKATRNIDEE
jgi:hypothetical protein